MKRKNLLKVNSNSLQLEKNIKIKNRIMELILEKDTISNKELMPLIKKEFGDRIAVASHLKILDIEGKISRSITKDNIYYKIRNKKLIKK